VTHGRQNVAILVSLLVTVVAQPLQAEPLPADGGIIDVRNFGAVGNGRTDDTAALLRAIAASGDDTGTAFWQDRIVYLPKGTYLVSGTLLKRYANGQFGSGLILVGESRSNTTLKLEDNARGFDDARHKRAVVFTASKLLKGSPTAGGKDYTGLGEGNDAYMNSVEDLTIDVGKGNPGAVAIDYLANNLGAIRNVTLRAPSSSGAIGLSMTRKWPGPALIQNVDIDGFGVGIEVAQTEYGLTFDRIRLTNQRIIGLHNDQNALAMRDIYISGPAPLIANTGPKSFIAIDSSLLVSQGSSDLKTAIKNEGVVNVRGLKLDAQRSGGSKITGPLNGVLKDRGQWQAMPLETWLPQVADTPAVPQVPVDQWVNIAKFGATGDPNQDATEALRRLFDSGAAVVYLPRGTYSIGATVEVPKTVQRIVGMNSTLQILPARRKELGLDHPMLRVPTDGPPLEIERLHFDHTNQGLRTGVEITGARDVVIRDVIGAGVTLVDRKANGGRVFIEDVCCGKFQFSGVRPVFARQLNTEGGGTRIVNNGSPLWLLGLKTEGIATILENKQGGRSDIFGGLVYMVRQSDSPPPALVNNNGWLSASFAEESLQSGSRYKIIASHDGDSETKTFEAKDFPQRGAGRTVPRLVMTPNVGNSQ
jgi:hypothetical protein